MVNRFGIQTANNAKVISKAANMGEHRAHFRAALSILLIGLNLWNTGPRLVIRGHGRQTGIPTDGSRNILTSHFRKLGLGVKQIDVGRSPTLPKNDHPLGLGCEIGETVISNGFAQSPILVKQSGKGRQTNPGRAFAQKTTPGFLLK